MNKNQALILYKSKFWNKLSTIEICEFQLFEDVLCMPFSVYHNAVDESLGRPVYTHEFGLDLGSLRYEFEGKNKTFLEREEKRIEAHSVYIEKAGYIQEESGKD